MNYRNNILHLITDYFEIAPTRLHSERFYKSYTLPTQNPPYQIETTNAFDIYEIQYPYQLFLMDYNGSYSTMIFLNPHQQLFVNVPAEKETLSHLHQHNFFEFFYVLDGELDFVIESIHQRYIPGDCCIINPHARHVEEHHHHYTALYLSLSIDFFFDILADFSNVPNKNTELLAFFKRNRSGREQGDYLDFHPLSFIDSEHQNNVEEILYHITKELLFKDIGYQDLFTGYLKRLFSYLQAPTLYTCSNTQFQTTNENKIFERTLAYINSQKRKVTRQDLEDALHYNGNYISRVFQKNTGQSLTVYTRNICLNEAANLLLNTTLSTTEIIEKVGFKNRTAFYNQFKAKFGVTPDQYRHPDM